ncbi:MAG TPA: fused MFS/spermidine synthase [Nitrosomonas sp.]|nr:fused MFS/spermidine synthase [Nitrosomonas sp.]HMW21067.1 fused MFS/spermidine synthase [Nitrosomonas sp.]HMW69056.1 fused MFS/spermidine synthase [Nitrosomonas sp.]HMY61278.1 fused MFS/spermidine synthase [Nitrosomonas sp.]HMY89961.1 fused MFS/spermidine synthase [Nitrosomonas sp.]
MQPTQHNSFSNFWLYCTVFLTGAAVMIIELLGTRLIAPFYGASLYVWASLISVTMIALAMGYFLGGYWADRAKHAGLALIIGLAALLTMTIPWLVQPVLLSTDHLGLKLGTFISTLILFTPSLTMLGMVGPFAVKRITANLAGVGTSTGSIYAVSTVGSVIGTLFLGFYLFPQIGSREIIIGLAVGLFVLAFIVAIFERHQIPLIKTLSFVACFFFMGVSILLATTPLSNERVNQQDNDYQTRFERESLYGWVRVIDNPSLNLRLLTADASTIGAASISQGENVLTYQKIVKMIPNLVPNMKQALLIGQGAGHMATTLERKGIRTDTIEIDPAVAEAARDYFDFIPTGQTLIGDARYEIRKLKGPYDLVILDVFTGGSEPVHLLTFETLEQIKALLTPDGLLALNFVAFFEQGQNTALASVAKTLAQSFAHQLAFISEPDHEFNDFIFIASRQPLTIEQSLLNTQQTIWLKQRRIEIDQRKGIVLTDNFNPLEHLQGNKSEHYRRMMVDMIGTQFFIR